MFGSRHSELVALVLYSGAATALAIAGARDAFRKSRTGSGWPLYWFILAIFVFLLGIARFGNLGNVVTETGRREARAEGWYFQRQSFQELLVFGIVAAACVAVVGIGGWFVATDRHRYLPSVVAVFGLAGLASFRVISLHQLDTLLYRRYIAGVRFGTFCEAVCLLTVGVLALWSAATPAHERRAEDQPMATV